MNDAGALNALLTEQAEARCAEIRAAGEAQARQIAEAADARIAERAQEAHATLDAELAGAHERAVERAQAEANMVVKTTRDQIADGLLERVRQDLAALANSEQMRDVIGKLLREVLGEAPQGGTVLAPPAHADFVREQVQQQGRGDLQVEAHPRLSDGVAVQDARQTYRVTNSLSSRYARLERQARRHAMQRLFGHTAE